jgi:hypothetical protein
MKTKAFLLLFAFSCCTCSSLFAQNSNQLNDNTTRTILEQCRSNAGPDEVAYERKVDRAAYERKMQFYLNESTQRAITQYAVQIHIVTRDDGSGGTDIDDIRSEFENFINPYFAEIDVQFVECNPELYHSSTEYYVLGNGTEDPDVAGDAMSAAFNVANVINIYYVSDPDGACGWARFPWKLPVDYIVIANSCADNKSTTVHELGHYFGLYHTHETALGAESVTRDNSDGCWDCDSEGDLLCDTPADPNLTSTASNFPSCAYFGTDTDACNGDGYAPSINNIMSYADKACRTNFTSQQKARMELYRDGDRSYLQTGCPCEKPVAQCKNINVSLSAAGSASITPSSVDNGSTWDCGLDTWSLSLSSFNCNHVGPNIVTLTVVDDLGWESTCQSTVTVADVTKPTIVNPAMDMTVECDGSGNIAAFSNWLSSNGGASATDACGGAWSNSSVGLSNGCGATGSETVIFKFTDPSGNESTTSATFTIEDNTNPSLTCPENIHLPECVETASWTVNASDACGNVSIVSNPPSGSVFAKGTTTVVTVTATDDCGNVSECTFEVTRDPDLEVDIDALATSSLKTCALGTNANIVLGYGGGPTCVTFNAVGAGGHAPYTFEWSSPVEIPEGYFENTNTASPTFCADFQTDPCVTYSFLVTITDIHGCTETDYVEVSVVNPVCSDGNKPKISVCHQPPGNPSGDHTICIGSNAVNSHLYGNKGHQDCLGACDAVCVAYSAASKFNQVANQQKVETDIYSLSAQPNPFSSNTLINFSVNSDSKIKLVVFDISGRYVTTLFEGAALKHVPYSVNFNAEHLHSGIYIVRMMGEDGASTNSTMIFKN